MMQCDICKDTTGPFEIKEHENRCKLVCEDCAKKIEKEEKEKEHVATCLFHKRYAN